jgi:hypothetical protein
MGLARFAGAGLAQGAKRFGFGPEVLRSFMPRSGTEWAMRLAPEALGIAAGYAYGGVPGAVEEGGLGFGGSVIGAVIGGGGAYGISRAMGQNRRARQQMMNSAAGLGDMVGSMGFSFLGPRPFTDEMRRKQQEEFIAQQQAEQHRLLAMTAGAPSLQNLDALFGGGA